jgi:hypothetical protein
MAMAAPSVEATPMAFGGLRSENTVLSSALWPYGTYARSYLSVWSTRSPAGALYLPGTIDVQVQCVRSRLDRDRWLQMWTSDSFFTDLCGEYLRPPLDRKYQVVLYTTSTVLNKVVTVNTISRQKSH